MIFGRTVNILFITSNRLGDAVLTTGLLGHLVESDPQARLTIACGPLPAPLFRAVPGLERLIPLTKAPWGRHWLGLWRECVTRCWDIVVDLRNSAVSRLIPVRRRAVLPRSRPGQHRVRQIGATLGLAVPPAPRLWFGETERRLARRLIPDGPPVVAVAPVANWIGKTWRIERFRDVALSLTGPDGILPGARLAVFGAPGERAAAAPLLEALPPHRCIDLVGGLDPLEAGACLACTSFFIGNDSGLMHLAAAAGVPTLGLFGPSRPEHYAPWGPHAAVAAVPFDEVVAQPGFSWQATLSWMDGLTVSAALAEARSLWSRVRSGPARTTPAPRLEPAGEVVSLGV